MFLKVWFPAHPMSEFPEKLVKHLIPGSISRLRNQNLWGMVGRNGVLRESIFNSVLQVILMAAGVKEPSGFVIHPVSTMG